MRDTPPVLNVAEAADTATGANATTTPEIALESSSAAEMDALLKDAPPAGFGSGGAAKDHSKKPVESEIIWEGLASYGNYNIFSIRDMTKLYTSGIEYDRHSWGYFLKARMDYVAEVLPFVLLVESANADYYGNPHGTDRKLLPGANISPIGLRMMWRSNTQHFKPYLTMKGGVVAFTQKALSPQASYENFSFQSGFGVQTKLSDRVDLRLGLWGDFHFSNGYVVPIDPGTDVMNANWGICYRLGQPRK